MEKSRILLLSLFLIPFVASAQLQGGARVGLNLSNQKWELGLDSQKDDVKPGFLLGGYLKVGVYKAFSIQPELLYSSQGSKTPDGNYSLGYISIPAFIRYDFNDMFNLHAGPQVGMLLSAKYQGADIKSSYENIDVGAVFGVGVDFDQLNAGIRYYQGLTNAFDDSTGEIKLTQSAFQIFAGYRLFGGE
jgi:hypothetical protein